MLAAFLPGAVLACATCGCSLSSDAAMGYSDGAGWLASIEYDYIDQDQLRSGSHAISRADVAALNPDAGQEVENRTTNRYLTFGLAYSPNADWNFRLLLPTIDRSHSTYSAATNPLTPDQLSSAQVSGLGDLKLIASYQGLLPMHNLGFQLGVKLPTGRYGGPNADGTGIVGRHPVSFGASGNAGGELLDTSLQAGTGSTDLILGAYFHDALSTNVESFVSGQFQAAVSERLDQAGADYRPGNSGTLTFGVRYEAHPDWVPQLQVNISHKSADQGALADTADTQGTVTYLSPGINAALSSAAHAFLFVQVPVLRQLSGYQLSPHWTASLGLTYAF